jgi:LacI family transcriptional regulator
VLCGRPPLGAGTPATVIEYDNEGGAHAMTSHLLSMGHRRILFLGGAGSTTALGRERGYRRVREAMAGGRRFTAVFAATDMVAAGALTALHESGVDVPGEVSLAGYDDIPFARDLHPALTAVHVPYEEMGRTAVRTVLDRRADAGDEHRMLGTHVVLRASVRTAAPGVGV